MEKARIDVPVPSLRDLDNVSFFSPSPPVSASSILVETPSRIDRDEDRGQIHGRLARIDARALITRSGSCCVGSTPEVEPYPETSSLLPPPLLRFINPRDVRSANDGSRWIDRGVARFLPFRIRNELESCVESRGIAGRLPSTSINWNWRFGGGGLLPSA